MRTAATLAAFDRGDEQINSLVSKTVPVRECLVYYDRNTQMMTDEWDTLSSKESFPMKDPLLSDSKYCSMFSEGIIRDDDVIFKNNDGMLEICDLRSGERKKTFPDVPLTDFSYIRSENARVYVNDDHRIFEVTPEYDLELVATAEVDIEDFCVIFHDDNEFRFAVLAAEGEIHFLEKNQTGAVRTMLKHEIPGAFEILGKFRGDLFIRTLNPGTFYNDNSISIINDSCEEGLITIDEHCLGAQVVGDKIYVKHGTSVSVIDIKTRSVIRKTTECLEANCYLIKRCYS